MTRPHNDKNVSPHCARGLAALRNHRVHSRGCQQCLNIYTIMQDHAIQYKVDTHEQLYQLNLCVVYWKSQLRPRTLAWPRVSECIKSTAGQSGGVKTWLLFLCRHNIDRTPASTKRFISSINMWRCLICRDVVWLLLKQGLMILRYSFCLLLEEGRVVLVNLAPRTI